jgi:hypothetical protein
MTGATTTGIQTVISGGQACCLFVQLNKIGGGSSAGNPPIAANRHPISPLSTSLLRVSFW